MREEKAERFSYSLPKELRPAVGVVQGFGIGAVEAGGSLIDLPKEVARDPIGTGVGLATSPVTAPLEATQRAFQTGSPRDVGRAVFVTGISGEFIRTAPATFRTIRATPSAIKSKITTDPTVKPPRVEIDVRGVQTGERVTSAGVVRTREPRFLGFEREVTKPINIEAVVKERATIQRKVPIEVAGQEVGSITQEATATRVGSVVSEPTRVPTQPKIVGQAETIVSKPTQAFGATGREAITVFEPTKGKPIGIGEAQLSKEFTSPSGRVTKSLSKGTTDSGVQIRAVSQVRNIGDIPRSITIQEGLITAGQELQKPPVSPAKGLFQTSRAVARQEASLLKPPTTPPTRPPVARPISPIKTDVSPTIKPTPSVQTRPSSRTITTPTRKQVPQISKEIPKPQKQRSFDDMRSNVFQESKQVPAGMFAQAAKDIQDTKPKVNVQVSISQGQIPKPRQREDTISIITPKQEQIPGFKPDQIFKQQTRQITRARTEEKIRPPPALTTTPPKPPGFGFGVPFAFPQSRKKKKPILKRDRGFREFRNPIRRITGL